MRFNLQKAILIVGVPIIWIKFMEMDPGLSWYKIFLAILGTLGGFAFGLEGEKQK